MSNIFTNEVLLSNICPDLLFHIEIRMKSNRVQPFVTNCAECVTKSNSFTFLYKSTTIIMQITRTNLRKFNLKKTM